MTYRRSLVLASGSVARRELLASAGVRFDVVPAEIDEAEARDGYIGANPRATPRSVALHLAHAKAEAVARRRPRAIVIGADQVLAANARVLRSRLAAGKARRPLLKNMLFKADDLEEAREVLRALRGIRHTLISAVVIVGGGQPPWAHTAEARLTMRDFSDAFLERYLALEGEGITAAVGCYRIEGRGIQLFEAVAGAHSTVLGLPLLPVLAELRRRGVLIA